MTARATDPNRADLDDKIDATIAETENGPRPQDRPVPAAGQPQAADLPDPPARHEKDTQPVEGEDAMNPPLAYYGGRRGDVQG